MECRVEDYNSRRLISMGTVEWLVVEYKCTLRGTTREYGPIGSDIYINVNTGRCGSEYRDACR